MKKIILIILITTLSTVCNGQTVETKYYGKNLKKEVPQEKAKFSQTTIQNSDGTVTTEVKDFRTNRTIKKETYKGNEPYGIWTNGGFLVDYNFPLIYSDEKCADSIPIKVLDYFKDNDSLNYKAPEVDTDGLLFYQFLAKNIRYPEYAIENNIQGKVYLTVTLTKEGKIGEVVVFRGTNVWLDKEAVRVMRKMQFNSLPTVNGQPYTCLMITISFKLM